MMISENDMKKLIFLMQVFIIQSSFGFKPRQSPHASSRYQLQTNGILSGFPRWTFIRHFKPSSELLLVYLTGNNSLSIEVKYDIRRKLLIKIEVSTKLIKDESLKIKECLQISLLNFLWARFFFHTDFFFIWLSKDGFISN